MSICYPEERGCPVLKGPELVASIRLWWNACIENGTQLMNIDDYELKNDYRGTGPWFELVGPNVLRAEHAKFTGFTGTRMGWWRAFRIATGETAPLKHRMIRIDRGPYKLRTTKSYLMFGERPTRPIPLPPEQS